MDSSNTNDANVLRPTTKRWFPRWISKIRRAGSLHPPENNRDNNQISDCNNVHFFPAAKSSTNYSDRIGDLELQNAVLIGDCAEWITRIYGLEYNLHRARAQLTVTENRMWSMGESIPDTTTETLSVLQESYRNFEMAVTLQEKKLEKALQRITSLQEKRACIAAEILALSPAPEQDVTNPEITGQHVTDQVSDQSDPNFIADDFKDAA